MLIDDSFCRFISDQVQATLIAEEQPGAATPFDFEAFKAAKRDVSVTWRLGDPENSVRFERAEKHWRLLDFIRIADEVYPERQKPLRACF